MPQTTREALCGLFSFSTQPQTAPEACRSGEAALQRSHASRSGFNQRANRRAIDAFSLACRRDADYAPAHAGLVRALREANSQPGRLRSATHRQRRQAQALQHLGRLLACDDATAAAQVLEACDDLLSGTLSTGAEAALRREVIPALGRRLRAPDTTALPHTTVLAALTQLVRLQPWAAACTLALLPAYSRTANAAPAELAELCTLLKLAAAVNSGACGDVIEVVGGLLPGLGTDAAASMLCIEVLDTVCRACPHSLTLLPQCIALMRQVGCALPWEACGYEAVRVVLRCAKALGEHATSQSAGDLVACLAIAAARAILAEAGADPHGAPLREMAQRTLVQVQQLSHAQVSQAASQALLELTALDAL